MWAFRLTLLVGGIAVTIGKLRGPGFNTRRLQMDAGKQSQGVMGAQTTASPTRSPVQAPVAPVAETSSTSASGSGSYCTCNSCTEAIWNLNVEGYTCGDRITHLQSNYASYYPTQTDACRYVAGLELPSACGACNPDSCDGRTPPTPPSSYCGCSGCTHSVWTSQAESLACGARITWTLQNDATHNTESGACSLVAQQFPEVCGACDPQSCVAPTAQPVSSSSSAIVKETSSTLHCGCTACTDTIWNTVAGDYRCGDRIDWVMSVEGQTEDYACRLVSNEFPEICGKYCNPDSCDGQTPASAPAPAPPSSSTSSTHCGCTACTDSIWNTMAGDYKCGDRITWIMGAQGQSEEYACRLVSNEFSGICGPYCNPDQCGSKTGSSAVSTKAPLRADTNLYCYPSYANRKRWTNVWGNYVVEVKEDGGVCGPGNNLFSRDTVSLDNGELTLQFKKVNGNWYGSEVRVAMPQDSSPFNYGTYKFSVKSIVHSNTATGQVIANYLPPSLILGLFTWDDTENYAIHENYNHEVDVEISRWGDPNDLDAQFLIQPPEQPQWDRFSTMVEGTYDQAHPYEFTWNPSEVKWYTSAGGGHYFSYSSRDALDSNMPDRVQCLPANMEIRMNLWNMNGAVTPMDMSENDMVEVVIDKFTYAPSGQKGVAVGRVCTKNCQCQSGLCTNNVCAQSL